MAGRMDDDGWVHRDGWPWMDDGWRWMDEEGESEGWGWMDDQGTDVGFYGQINGGMGWVDGWLGGHSRWTITAGWTVGGQLRGEGWADRWASAPRMVEAALAA